MGKLILTNKCMEKKIGNFRRSHQKQSTFTEKLHFTKQPFCGKLFSLGGSGEGCAKHAEGCLGGNAFGDTC